MLGGCVIVINVVVTKGIIFVTIVVGNTRQWLVNIIVSKILVKTPVSLLLLYMLLCTYLLNKS